MLENRIAAPVEIAVLEFPGRRFDGEIVPALAELVDDGIVTILDLRLVSKDVDGSVAIVEVGELDGAVAAAVAELGAAAPGLLSDDDIASTAGALSLGSSALLIVWEDTWAGRLAEAVAAAGGRLVTHDRLDAATARHGR